MCLDGNQMMDGDFTLSGWLVEARLGRVTRKTKTIHLEPQVMKVLVYLAAHAREVVTKDRLISALWPDTVVGDAALARCISQIRVAFGDDAKRPRFVETVPKVGYRLIANVGEARPAKRRPVAFRRTAAAATALVLLSIGQSGGNVQLPEASEPSEAVLAYVNGRSAYDATTYAHNQNAIALFERAVELDPEFAVAYARLADALTQQARYWGGDRVDDALEFAKHAVELKPACPVTLTALGTALIMNGDEDGGLDAYSSALELDPDHWQPALESAHLQFQRRQFDAAEELYLQALRNAPEHDVAMSNLGYLYLKMGEVDEARTWLNRALERLPLQAQASSRLAMLEMFTGFPNEAVSRCGRIKEAFPGHYACLQVMAIGSLMTGDLDNALRGFEDVVAAFPDDRYARLGQAQVLLANAKRDEAMELIDEVEALSMKKIAEGNEDSYDYWLIAGCHTLRGNVAEAFEWFDKAAEAGRRFYLWDANDPLLARLHGDSRFDRYISATKPTTH
jgi:DNA-binding winged helix-turn-helix (wHTH) protein/Flp pilus assembly protein TadD